MGEYPVRSDSMRKGHAEIGVTSGNKQSTIEMHLISHKGTGSDDVVAIATACFSVVGC